MADHQVYRAVIRLYPREFRNQYGDDLLQAHADLTLEHGRLRAAMRTALDVAVTVPRYRLETIMTTRHSDLALNIFIATLLVVGVLAALNGGLLLGALPLLIAAVAAIANRSRLTRSLRSPDGNQRRRRLRTAAVLGGICVVTLAVFVIDIGNDDSWGGRAFFYITIFNIAFVAAMIYLVTGLATRRSSSTLMPSS
jgi:hypothetical protein